MIQDADRGKIGRGDRTVPLGGPLDCATLALVGGLVSWFALAPSEEATFLKEGYESKLLTTWPLLVIAVLAAGSAGLAWILLPNKLRGGIPWRSWPIVRMALLAVLATALIGMSIVLPRRASLARSMQQAAETARLKYKQADDEKLVRFQNLINKLQQSQIEKDKQKAKELQTIHDKLKETASNSEQEKAKYIAEAAAKLRAAKNQGDEALAKLQADMARQLANQKEIDRLIIDDPISAVTPPTNPNPGQAVPGAIDSSSGSGSGDDDAKLVAQMMVAYMVGGPSTLVAVVLLRALGVTFGTDHKTAKDVGDAVLQAFPQGRFDPQKAQESLNKLSSLDLGVRKRALEVFQKVLQQMKDRSTDKNEIKELEQSLADVQSMIQKTDSEESSAVRAELLKHWDTVLKNRVASVEALNEIYIKAEGYSAKSREQELLKIAQEKKVDKKIQDAFVAQLHPTRNPS